MEIPENKPIEEEKKVLPIPPLPGLAIQDPKKKFRVRGKSLAITYPQCKLAIKDVFENLRHKLPTATHIRIVKEKHEDGNPHFHALVQSSHSLDIKNASWLDVRSHHPNIQRVNDSEAWNRYLSKDKDLPGFEELSIGTFESIGMKKARKTKEKNAIFLKLSVKELVDSGEIPLIQLPLIKKARDFYFKEGLADEKFKRIPLPPRLIFQFKPHEITEVGEMDMDYPILLNEKKCHLWIVSPPDYGKTTFARWLRKTYRAEMWNAFNNQTEISPDTQIIIMDEISEKTKPDVALINTICDGNGYINAKYGGFTQNGVKSLVIILSNFQIEEVYPVEACPSINARFNVLDLEKCRFEPSVAGTISFTL